MADDLYRPNLNYKKEYLDKVAGLIKSDGPIDEIRFEYLLETLLELGIQANPYDNYPSDQGTESIKAILEESFQQIALLSESESVREKLYRLWDYLAESDPLEPSDLIYVFGGIGRSAVLEGIRLQKDGFAQKIMFSGNKPSYAGDVPVTEAEEYAALAIAEGVNPEDILIEKESVNTPENIVNSGKILRELDFLPKKVIAVSVAYHMRRASLTMRAGFDWEYKLIRHAGPSTKYSRETYFNDINGWSYVFYEYLKMYGARAMGHF
ncbi:MAG TPA: YdcF family protein [Candidatus Paceibacterota bacterium]|nr:YdcF family protein [Candidatus Paceibacterota bacterium]